MLKALGLRGLVPEVEGAVGAEVVALAEEEKSIGGTDEATEYPTATRQLQRKAWQSCTVPAVPQDSMIQGEGYQDSCRKLRQVLHATSKL